MQSKPPKPSTANVIIIVLVGVFLIDSCARLGQRNHGFKEKQMTRRLNEYRTVLVYEVKNWDVGFISDLGNHSTADMVKYCHDFLKRARVT